jgi:hypothetical protein
MPELNPYRDNSPFGTGKIGGVPIAGVIQSINGAEKPEEWTFQKGTGGNNAVSVWKGTKLAEGIEIVVSLFGIEQYDAHELLRRTLRPKLGQKPPSLPIENGIINAAGVVLVVCISAPPAIWIRAGGFWQATIKLAEYNEPKAANTGRAGPASFTQGGTPPKTAGEKQLSEILDEAAKL